MQRNESLEYMRQEYGTGHLSEQDFSADPIAQFGLWFDQAKDSGVFEPNAFTLATTGSDGVPSTRTVLLKDFDPSGFVFYTNYHSAKAADIFDNPAVALHFFWSLQTKAAPVDRCVRIKGYAEKTSRALSQSYFATRPRSSQIGAWASPQSTVLHAGRKQMEQHLAQTVQRFKDVDPVPVPPHWGGYLVRPFEIEFWQGAGSRMHDRLRYRRQVGGAWILERLAP